MLDVAPISDAVVVTPTRDAAPAAQLGASVTVFSADGFASVVGKVVDNLRSEAATGRPDPWIAQQVKQRGVADAAKLTLVRCSHCGAANDAAKICCGECGLSLGL